MVKKSYESPVSTLIQREIQKACLITSTSTEMVQISETYDSDDFVF